MTGRESAAQDVMAVPVLFPPSVCQPQETEAGVCPCMDVHSIVLISGDICLETGV